MAAPRKALTILDKHLQAVAPVAPEGWSDSSPIWTTNALRCAKRPPCNSKSWATLRERR